MKRDIEAEIREMEPWKCDEGHCVSCPIEQECVEWFLEQGMIDKDYADQVKEEYHMATGRA